MKEYTCASCEGTFTGKEVRRTKYGSGQIARCHKCFEEAVDLAADIMASLGLPTAPGRKRINTLKRIDQGEFH